MPVPALLPPLSALPPIINKHFCFAIKEQRWRIILARAALAYVSTDINLKIKSMPPPPELAATRGGGHRRGAAGMGCKRGPQKGAQSAPSEVSLAHSGTVLP